MRNRKTYVIIIFIFVVFFIIMFSLFGISEIRKGKQDLTLLIGNRTVWKYHGKKWLNITNSIHTQNLDWKKYHVYANGEYKGELSLWHSDKWYAFDDTKNAVSLDGEFLAYSSNYQLNFYPFQEEKITDYSSVKEVLEMYELPRESSFSSAYHILFDFDSDGTSEDFYVISNAFSYDEEVDDVFSFVYMVKNNTIYMIYEDVSKNVSFNGCKPFFTSIMDVEDDKTYEFILSCGRYSISEQIDMLYQFQNNSFKILISSE